MLQHLSPLAVAAETHVCWTNEGAIQSGIYGHLGFKSSAAQAGPGDGICGWCFWAPRSHSWVSFVACHGSSGLLTEIFFTGSCMWSRSMGKCTRRVTCTMHLMTLPPISPRLLSVAPMALFAGTICRETSNPRRVRYSPSGWFHYFVYSPRNIPVR